MRERSVFLYVARNSKLKSNRARKLGSNWRANAGLIQRENIIKRARDSHARRSFNWNSSLNNRGKISQTYARPILSLSSAIAIPLCAKVLRDNERKKITSHLYLSRCSNHRWDFSEIDAVCRLQANEHNNLKFHICSCIKGRAAIYVNVIQKNSHYMWTNRFPINFTSQVFSIVISSSRGVWFLHLPRKAVESRTNFFFFLLLKYTRNNISISTLSRHFGKSRNLVDRLFIPVRSRLLYR